jgi:STIP1 family protein 1
MNSINENVVFQIPDYLICNITLDLMEDPVITESGHTYERTAIEEHIQRNGKTDPFSRKPISGLLYPSISIKKAIEDFLEKNPWAYEFHEG